MKLSLLAYTLISASLLTACIDEESDSDSGSDNIGVFIDSPVKGLAYASGSVSGFTDDAGRFNYESGESVQFSMGAITLPAVQPKAAIHISDLYSGGINDERTINLARLFLAIDASDDEGLIVINQSTIDAATEINVGSLDFSSASFDADVANFIAESGAHALPSAQEAKDHIAETKAEVEGLLTGCGNECVPKATFREYTGPISPRFGEINVPVNTNVSITLDQDFPLNLTQVNVEMFGLPVDSYENCRIDWPGFRCASIGIDSYSLPDLHIVFGENANIDNQTVNFSVSETLNSGYTYVVHVFADGGENDSYSYKTWWNFNTVE